MSPLVRLRDVHKQYPNGVAALESIDLIINEGEFVSIVGPSGCGKSTLLNLIAGLDKPSSGSIAIAGKTSKDSPAGYVFQTPTLLPWLTTLDNVALPLMLDGVGKYARTEHAQELLRLVGLETFADAYPRELSGGMQMRASIARALITRPKLLLMDEPFGALDELTRQYLNQELLRLKGLIGTIAFVTHSVWEAAFLSDRVVVMSSNSGHIIDQVYISATERTPEFRDSPAFHKAAAAIRAALKGKPKEVK